MEAPDDTGSRDDVTFEIGSDAIIAALQAENALLRTENATLRERLAALERRFGLNSTNSGKWRNRCRTTILSDSQPRCTSRV